MTFLRGTKSYDAGVCGVHWSMLAMPVQGYVAASAECSGVQSPPWVVSPAGSTR